VSHSKHRPDIELTDSEAAQKIFTTDMRRILSPRSVVLDVGANRGQFAGELLEIESLSRIYCFEPVPDAFAYLESLAASDSRILPVQAAISTKSGVIPFFVTKSDVGSSMLRPISGQPSQWLTLNEEIMVESMRLDEFIKSKIGDHVLTIDLLKSDAQGADKLVLESAGDELSPQRIRTVLIEVNFSEFYESQDRYTEVLELLDRRGYRPARIYPHRAHDDWLWWADILFVGK
jgi:FkbM family methyltransferase